MTWLKKAGSILLKVVGIASGVLPFVPGLIGSAGVSGSAQTAIQSDLAKIGAAVTTVEAVGQALQAPGTAKLTAAVPLVSQIIQTSELLSGKKIANEAAFTAAVQNITSGVADLLNSLE